MVNKLNFSIDDSYDDSDYADYETKDYDEPNFNSESEFDDDDDYEPKVKGGYGRKTSKNKKGDKSEYFDDEKDLYNHTFKIESGERMKELFTKYKEDIVNGTPEEKAEATEKSCAYMVGLIKKEINKGYFNYIKKDPDYYKELMDECFANIIKNLPAYDPDKGQPSTFFTPYIKSALSTTTTVTKHNTSPTDAAPRNKINAIREKYERAYGSQPTIYDYAVETGEPLQKIKYILKMNETERNAHLDSIAEHEELIPGDPNVNTSFVSPENATIQKITIEQIIKRTYQLFDPTSATIYLRNKYNGESIQSIAADYGGKKYDDKIRRIIESVNHTLYHDHYIRKICSGFIGSSEKIFNVNLLPIEGEEENMDLLEDIPL